MSYNAIKSWWPIQERGLGVQLTAGLVAGSCENFALSIQGLVAQTVSHPFHVLKERMKGNKSYALLVAAQIIRQDGRR